MNAQLHKSGNWFTGEHIGISAPADPTALREGGAAFLELAFRASGAFGENDRVVSVSSWSEIESGSTGRKAAFTARCIVNGVPAENELFVKFSRHFDDERRDSKRIQMANEVPFGLLTLLPGFPIRAPRCYFADYDEASGSGILIAERIRYDQDGVEPHYEKCMDHELPDAPGHYQAIIEALARLAGTQRSGALGSEFSKNFPFDPSRLAVDARRPFDASETASRIESYVRFVQEHGHLVPAPLASPRFIERFQREGMLFQQNQHLVPRELQSREEMIAFCHWNAHVDNAWFWRNGDGRLQCGLMDWGNASLMNISMAIWGTLSGAEPSLLDNQLDGFVDTFARIYRESGGPALDSNVIHRHLALYVGQMAMSWMLDTPDYLIGRVPDLPSVGDRFDPRICGDERARSMLSIMVAAMTLWERYDMECFLRDL